MTRNWNWRSPDLGPSVDPFAGWPLQTMDYRPERDGRPQLVPVASAGSDDLFGPPTDLPANLDDMVIAYPQRNPILLDADTSPKLETAPDSKSGPESVEETGYDEAGHPFFWKNAKDPWLREAYEDPLVRSMVDSGWKDSKPGTQSAAEHGFFIGPNLDHDDGSPTSITNSNYIVTPFTGSATDRRLDVSPPPAGTIVWEHTHPVHEIDGGKPRMPSPSDLNYAEKYNLPGMIMTFGGPLFFAVPPPLF